MTTAQRILFSVGLLAWFAFVLWYSLQRTRPYNWPDIATGSVLFVIAGFSWTSCLIVTLLRRRQR